jgi:hypothetical protein
VQEAANGDQGNVIVKTAKNFRSLKNAGNLPPDTLLASISRPLLFSHSKHQFVRQRILSLN